MDGVQPQLGVDGSDSTSTRHMAQHVADGFSTAWQHYHESVAWILECKT